MNKPEDFMQRALDLALLGQGLVAPNPMVGCVIVKNNQVIGEGWHQQFGQAHAEVNAIQSIPSHLSAEDADVFVTLEPCNHFGKTPPCSDLLISKKVKRIFICNLDPNPLVAGAGIKKLRQAGIEVITDILPQKGETINSHFFSFHRRKRPYITLKYATSKDQFLSQINGSAVQFSNEMSKTLVHKLRSSHQAILIGANTANWDNPQLTNRLWKGNNPIRIVLDPNNRLSEDITLLKDDYPTWIFTSSVSKEIKNKIWFALETKNAEAFLQKMLGILTEKNMQSILVEGGAFTLSQFLKLQLFDEIIHIESTQKLHEGILAPALPITFQQSFEVGKGNRWKVWNRKLSPTKNLG